METRLGDIIDDFCIKCKRLTNHQVVSILGTQPAKVRCRTCYSDHDYRNEQAPPPKVDPRKAALFKEVLERANLPAAPSEEVDAEVAPAEVAPAAIEEPLPNGARRSGSRRAQTGKASGTLPPR